MTFDEIMFELHVKDFDKNTLEVEAILPGDTPLTLFSFQISKHVFKIWAQKIAAINTVVELSRAAAS